MTKFIIHSEDSEILLQLEKSSNLREVALILGKDVSVISRKLTSLSERTPFLTKFERQWRLTGHGLRYNEWTRRAMLEQQSIMNSTDRLKIITTREFSSKILCPSLSWWKSQAAHIEITTTDDGIENSLLSGQADFGFDCGNPYSPQIAFKKGIKEVFAVVFSPKLKVKSMADLQSHPMYLYNRIDLPMIRKKLHLEYLNPQLIFNDMSSVRSALIHSEGWSVLPRYCVADDIQNKRLVELGSDVKLEPTYFGLWWNRENAPHKDVLAKAFRWLEKQEL